MIRVENFERARLSHRSYGGNAGKKVGIRWNGDNWLLKFSTADHGREGSSHSSSTAPAHPQGGSQRIAATSAVSEYLASHIYESMGIPTQQTLLGIREGKLVCACRDFVGPRERLYDFHELKNSLSDNLPGFARPASDGMSRVMSDITAAIEQLDVFPRVEKAQERFWDMFVTDAFLSNAARDNTNWGVLITDSTVTLTPVYDNGSAFATEFSDDEMGIRITHSELLKADARQMLSFFITDTGKPVDPLEYIASGVSAQCTAALQRFVDHFDIVYVSRLFEGLPLTCQGRKIITENWRRYQLALLHLRFDQVFLPLYHRLVRKELR